MGIVLAMLLWVIDIPLWTQIVGTSILGMRMILKFLAACED